MKSFSTGRRSFFGILLAAPLALTRRLFGSPVAANTRLVTNEVLAHDALDAFFNHADNSLLKLHGFNVEAPANDAFLAGLKIHGPIGRKVQSYRMIFPDFHVTLLSSSVNGDVVTMRWNAEGSHRGEVPNLKPSGKHANVPGTSQVTFVYGKITKFTSAFDHQLLRSQLGLPRG